MAHTFAYWHYRGMAVACWRMSASIHYMPLCISPTLPISTCLQTCLHISLHTCPRTGLHTSSHACQYVCAHVCTQVCAQVYTHAYARVYMHVCTQVHSDRVWLNTFGYARLHTRPHACPYTCPCSSFFRRYIAVEFDSTRHISYGDILVMATF